MQRSLKLYQNGKKIFSKTIDTMIEFNLDHKKVNEGEVYTVPLYTIRNDQLPEQGDATAEYLFFISEETAHITVLQPVAYGVYDESQGCLSQPSSISLVHNAPLYSFDFVKGAVLVKTPSLKWRYDASNDTFICPDAVNAENYTLYYATRIAAKGGALPMVARSVENMEEAGDALTRTHVFCESKSMTRFYYGGEV